MRKKLRNLAIGGLLVGATLVFLHWTDTGRRTQFAIGGGLVAAGFRLQDHLEGFDSIHHEDITPEHVYERLVRGNRLVSRVHNTFPRMQPHPVVAIVVCMDGRLDTHELAGDTRKYYYVIRTAGSVLSERDMEMLELAVANGVKLIVLTTHSDCAAEKIAKDPEQRKRYPALAAAIDMRETRIRELLARPAIKTPIDAGKLLVKLVNIDTRSEGMLPR